MATLRICAWMSRAVGLAGLAWAVVCGLTSGAMAQPVVTPVWTTAGVGTAVAAAPLGGLVAVAQTASDTVEVRDSEGRLLATITRVQIAALCTWMNLDTSGDGPSALGFSDSGRLLYIAVHDATVPGDGQPSDAILRYDTQTGEFTRLVRLEIAATDNLAAAPSLAHFRGRLYVGLTGSIRTYRAEVNDRTATSLLATSSPASAAGFMVEGLAIDRLTGRICAAWNNSVQRATIVSGTMTFAAVGTVSGARGLAWSDHYGNGTTQAGLYVLDSFDSPAATARVLFLTAAMARGTASFSPTTYSTQAARWRGLAATATGELVSATGSGVVGVRDASDPRLGLRAWMEDEFRQHVRLVRGLISPDGEPDGWVIDADVIPAWSRFHPATPDAAAWAVLVLMMNDHVFGDAAAIEDVRRILTRYAGLHPDGIKPSRTADGIFRHWIDPLTGAAKPGWDPEFATLSTMKIVIAAARARAFYPSDQAIASAAEAIICGVKNWDGYVDPNALTMSYKGLAGGGADWGSIAQPYMEGLMFVEQAARYGGAGTQTAYTAWLTRVLWPSATYVIGRAVTGDSSGSFQSAFINIYPLLTSRDFRARAEWATQIVNARVSPMAWTDDNGPVWATVFSAGTTKGIWGGYHADALNNSPGNISTFTALLGFSAGTGLAPGYLPPAVGAYQAYRVGARQVFKSGANLLYRRSSVDPAYTPDSAGLPDVSMGALGLAELLRPGSVASVLTGAYPACGGAGFCVMDYNADGTLNLDDLSEYVTDFYSTPAIPGGVQAAAPTSPDAAIGYGTPCPLAADALPPYSAGAYRASGFRVGFSGDASNDCPADAGQSFPSLDNLSEFITAYYAAFTAGGC
jgi:hypothetical protein